MNFVATFLVALFGVVRILMRRWIILGLTALILLGAVAETFTSVPRVVGTPWTLACTQKLYLAAWRNQFP